MGVWEEATRFVHAVTANGCEVACCVTSCLLRTGARHKFVADTTLLIGENTYFLHISIM